jgi:hypothetical protein
MMRSYSRGGAASVYWLLLPAPRGKQFQTVFGPVNRGIELAAASFPDVVHLVDLRRTFTPGGTFRQTIPWQGHIVNARQADGVHLTAAGAEVAAQLVLRAMRHDGVLG